MFYCLCNVRTFPASHPALPAMEYGGAEAAGGRRKLGMCGMMAFAFAIFHFTALDAGKHVKYKDMDLIQGGEER